MKQMKTILMIVVALGALFDFAAGTPDRLAYLNRGQVQFHVRTDFSKADPFCPSTAAMKRGIDLLHAHGITVQALSWTEGKNPELYRRLWDLGFDNLCTDDPLVLFEFLNELKAKEKGEAKGI